MIKALQNIRKLVRRPRRHRRRTANCKTTDCNRRRRLLNSETLESRLLLTVDPQVTLDVDPDIPGDQVSSQVLLGESAPVVVTFDNDSFTVPQADELGYGPFVDLVLQYRGASNSSFSNSLFPFGFTSPASEMVFPPAFPLASSGLFDEEPDGLGVDKNGDPVRQLVTASVLGRTLSPNLGELIFTPVTAAGGMVQHPFALAGSNPLMIQATQGDMLVTARLPFGSFAFDQPPVEVEFDIHVSSAADVGAPLYVRARGGI